VGIIGSVGWFVYNSGKNTKSTLDKIAGQNNTIISKNVSTSQGYGQTLQVTPPQSSPTTPPPPPANVTTAQCSGTYTYKNASAGYSISCKKGSTLVYESGNGNLTITSSDYTVDDYGCCGPYPKTGSKIDVVTRSFTKENPHPTPTIQELLTGKWDVSKTKSRYTNIKGVTLSGIKGVQYVIGYEGPPLLISEVEKGDINYSISMELRVDDTGIVLNGSDISDYNSLINSFDLLN
jgi:hypothetical protein